MKQTKKWIRNIVQEYPQTGVAAALDFEHAVDTNVAMCLVSFAKISVARHELAFWVVWQTTQHIYLAVLLDEKVRNVVNSKVFRPEMLPYYQDATTRFVIGHLFSR